MICIGIDPGKDGALAMIFGEFKTKIVSFGVDGKDGYFNALEFYRGVSCVCALERVGAMRGQGVTSMFSFGENYGFIQGLLTAFEIPYELVTPQKWKREFGVTGDKNTSVEVCKRLFPGVNLRKSDRCKKEHDGMAEALLLAEYARRHML